MVILTDLRNQLVRVFAYTLDTVEKQSYLIAVAVAQRRFHLLLLLILT